MRFGQTLRESMHPPWKAEYIDYDKLKALLRDSDNREDHEDDVDNARWTEDDENRFCDEIFNVQLEKVAGFQERKAAALRDAGDALFEKLRALTPGSHGGDEKTEGKGKEGAGVDDKEATDQRVGEIEAELDRITNELRALRRYSSLNYTGFLKIAKKHDRKRGTRYRVRPMVQVSLARRPFNTDNAYSSLLAKLSLMYEAVHQYRNPVGGGSEDGGGSGGGGGGVGGGSGDTVPGPEGGQQGTRNHGEHYTAFKFWVHPDNLLEVKTMVLRHLPALVYRESSAKEADPTADPTLTSLYFDNEQFELYNRKMDGLGGSGDTAPQPLSPSSPVQDATSLRLRWFGPLATRPELYLEQKVVSAEDGTSEERRITIKDKYVKPFLDGTYHMEKSIQKMERQGERPEAVAAFGRTAEAMQAFVRDHELEPVLRANYVRTAFQKPADDRVRVSIDTNLAFVREDALDRRRPCRDPDEWHRRDLDDALGRPDSGNPFAHIPASDVSRFPFAVLEIKVREDMVVVQGGDGCNESGSMVTVPRKRPVWVEDLMASHLVHPTPHFSKFVHGVAVLFDDYINPLPPWLSDLDRDIRRDPQEAFEEEELRRAQRAADEQVVGSFLGTTTASGGGGGKLASSYKPTKSSPASKSMSYLAGRLASEASLMQRLQQDTEVDLATQQQQQQQQPQPETQQGHEQQRQQQQQQQQQQPRSYGAISSVLPSFSMQRYTKWRRTQNQNRDQDQLHGNGSSSNAELPAGVMEPTVWIKNAGPLRIEPKVWLANERTFLKWQHICVLLGSLAVALFTAAAGSGDSGYNAVAAWMGGVYISVAAFAGFWGWYMLQTRRDMILARSGRDFDNMLGPVVLSVTLMGALLLNLLFAYRAAAERWAHSTPATGVHNGSYVQG